MQGLSDLAIGGHVVAGAAAAGAALLLVPLARLTGGRLGAVLEQR